MPHNADYVKIFKMLQRCGTQRNRSAHTSNRAGHAKPKSRTTDRIN